MSRHKINWCDLTINPVVGCKNNCQYCYARKMYYRFNEKLGYKGEFSDIKFFPERLKKIEETKGKRIFLNSMSDISYWSKEQIKIIYSFMPKDKANTYIFLSKNPKAYLQEEFIEREDVIFGLTITNKASLSTLTDFKKVKGIKFLCIEPLLEDLGDFDMSDISWIVIGAETGLSKNKVKVEKEWVDKIIDKCRERNISFILKESLNKMYEINAL